MMRYFVICFVAVCVMVVAEQSIAQRWNGGDSLGLQTHGDWAVKPWQQKARRKVRRRRPVRRSAPKKNLYGRASPRVAPRREEPQWEEEHFVRDPETDEVISLPRQKPRVTREPEASPELRALTEKEMSDWLEGKKLKPKL